MEQLTLEEAALIYAKMLYPGASESNANYTRAKSDFIAGAKWQKEQSKELINLMRQLLSAYNFRLPDTKQLLVGYTNEQVFEKMNNLIERLQD